MLDCRATMERLAAFYKVKVVTTLEYEWHCWPHTNKRQMKLKQLKC